MKRAMTQPSVKKTKGTRMHNTLVYMRQHWQLYLIFMLPAVVLTIVFRYVPMGGILIAFTEYNPILGILGSEWVGFDHFTRFLSSPDFMQYLLNTLKLSVFGLLWGFPAPILLAFLLNRIMSSGIKQKIQLVLYMPNFISVIVLCGIVRILLSPTGMLNMLLGTSYNFMTMPEAFRTIYIASGIWKQMGWSSILYLATLSSVDMSLYEAAAIDGAGRFQKMLHISLPHLVPLICIFTIMNASSLINGNFDLFYVIPRNTSTLYATTDILNTYVYRSLQESSYAIGATTGLIQSVVGMFLVLLSNWIVKKISPDNSMF